MYDSGATTSGCSDLNARLIKSLLSRKVTMPSNLGLDKGRCFEITLKQKKVNKKIVRNGGIEPPPYAWEAHVLPLNQFRFSQKYSIFIAKDLHAK
jgi:hypothetical protein